MLNYWFKGNFQAEDDLSCMDIRGHGTRIAYISQVEILLRSCKVL